MINISTLRAMATAGASVEVILAAVEAEIIAEGARVQARKDRDAERQRRHRDAKAVTPSQVVSHGVTRRHSDTEVSLTSSSLLTSLENSTSKKEVSKKERARKCFLPDDWLPKPSHYAKASQAHVDRKADDLRNWAKSKAIMRADWDATFHGFLRPTEGSNGTGRQQNLGDVARELADEARVLERQAGVSRQAVDF